MRKRFVLASAAMAVAAAIALPVVAIASQGDHKITIGSHQFVTGPGSAAGTFAAVGDFDDSGTVESTFAFVPQGNQDAARVTGSQTFTGTLGTVQTTFTGIASPASSPRQVGHGTFEFVSGTGAYAGIRGHGTFTVVGDFTTGNVYATAEGQAHT
jgi:hypothetical protein